VKTGQDGIVRPTADIFPIESDMTELREKGSERSQFTKFPRLAGARVAVLIICIRQDWQ
jgi:hypothetical protein